MPQLRAWMWLRSEVGPKRGSLGTLRARTETIRGTLKYNSNAVPALHSRWIGDFRGGGGGLVCLFVCGLIFHLSPVLKASFIGS